MPPRSTARPQGRVARHPRLFGVAGLAIGVAMARFFGVAPLRQAYAGVPHVSYGIKAFVAGPMFAVFGLALILGGGRVGRAYTGPPRTREQHMLIWPAFIIAIAIGGVAYWWFTGQLRALGYVSGV